MAARDQVAMAGREVATAVVAMAGRNEVAMAARDQALYTMPLVRLPRPRGARLPPPRGVRLPRSGGGCHGRAG